MKIGSQSQNDDVKTCASTLHAVHVRGTYKIVALATVINRVFLIIASLLRANFYGVSIKLDNRPKPPLFSFWTKFYSSNSSSKSSSS